MKTMKTEYTYDDADNLTSMTDKRVVENQDVIYRYTAYTYDGLGRLTSVSECDTNQIPSASVIESNKVSYEYDGKDRLIEIHYPDCALGVTGLKFNYNIHGWLLNVKALNESGSEKLLREYTYTDDGKVGEIKDYTDFLNGTGKWLKRTYSYDKLNRPTAIEYTDNMGGSSSDVKASYTYTYDKNNNIIEENRINTYGDDNGAPYEQQRSYQYDENDRLILNNETDKSSPDDGGISDQRSYSYDAAGNKTAETFFRSTPSGAMEFTSSYTYNEFNQLISASEEELDEAFSAVYTYDANGNRISETRTDAFTNTQSQNLFTYDADNRLKTAIGKTGDTVDYTQENQYNGFGQRIQKKEGSDVTNYFYDGSSILYTTDTTDDVSSFNLIGAEDNILATARPGAESSTDFYTYIKDIRESTANVIGADGKAKVSYSYDEYGETTEYQQDAENPFYNEICYTAGIYDDTTKLYYLNARYYSPQTGNFLTQDTYRGSRSRTDTLNLYGYAAGNPIKYTDPSGHHPAVVAGIVVGVKLLSIGMGAYDGYKFAKKRKWKGWKKTTSVIVGALIGAVDPLKAVKVGSALYKTSKFSTKISKFFKRAKSAKAAASKGKSTSTDRRIVEKNSTPSKEKKDVQSIRNQGKKATPACFTAGTKIYTEKGFKAIEKIKPGDYVWSENPETHEKALKKVKKIFVREKDSIIRLSINGEPIKTTDEHPFYVEGQGFTTANKLKVGDWVRLEDGTTGTIESSQSIVLNEPIKVYNFEVEDFHTYYVSEQKVLVHNTCAETPKNVHVTTPGIQNKADLNSFKGGKIKPVTYGGGTVLYRVSGKNGRYWSLDSPPATEYQWRVDSAIKQEFGNDASKLYKITIPEGSTISGFEGTVGPQGMGLYGGAHQAYINARDVPKNWITIEPMVWK